MCPRLLCAVLALLTGATGCREQKAQPPPVMEARPAPHRRRVTPPPTFDLWYRVHADGQLIGYRRVTLEAASLRKGAPAALRFVSEQKTRATDGGKPTLRVRRMTEHCRADGTLRRLVSELREGGKRTVRRYDVEGQTLVITDPDSGSLHKKPLAAGPPPSGLCGLYLALLRGTETHTLRLLDPRTADLLTGHLLRRPGSKNVYRYSESHQPKVHIELVLGPTRLPVRQTVRGLGVTLRLSLSSRAEALRLTARPRPGPRQDLAVDLGARLPEPLTARRMRVALRLPKPLPEAALAELARGNQRRLPSTDPLHVIVERKKVGAVALPAAAAPYPLTKAHLRQTATYVKHPDPALDARDPRRTQIKTLLRGERTALRAVLRLTAWASIARTQGFSDRAALLTAALRAAGIPARLVFGFLYVGSVMTEHRWVEAHLGGWVGLDPESGGAAGATHLRLAVASADPRRAPDADWKLLRPGLRGLRAKLLEAELATGFRFVPGAQQNAHQAANVLYHRVWNLVVRRPLTARFVVGGAADAFEVAVVSTDAAARLELQLYAASPAGLDVRSFLSMGFQVKKIGLRRYLVKELKPKAGQSLRRAYVQLSCSDKPWGARLVRWTLTATGAKPAQIAALEQKTLGTFTMTGRSADVLGCTKRTP